MELHHKGSPPPKQFRTQPLAGKIMASVFWDSEVVIHVDFLPSLATANAQYYSNLLFNEVHAAFYKKRPGKLSKGIILVHDNACPHMENLTTVTLAKWGWEILNHPPYSMDSAPGDWLGQ
jgi:hypothetical protein